MPVVSPGRSGASRDGASAVRPVLCDCTKPGPEAPFRPACAARPLPLARAKSRRYSGAHVGEPEDCVFAGIPVRVVRKRVKNVSLRIARDGSRVDVSAPTCVPLPDIEAFVVQKRVWIEKRLAEAAASPAARAERATPDELAEWRSVVSACVPVLVEAWEPVMGVKAGRLDYRNMKSRWGSCQPSTGRICINVRLALYPPECLEYVVVHELCHLLVPGHGEPFRRLMDAYLPDWKARRDKLR